MAKGITPGECWSPCVDNKWAKFKIVKICKYITLSMCTEGENISLHKCKGTETINIKYDRKNLFSNK